MSIKRPRIFLDSGDPAETHKAKSLLGFLDGQTTNPSLIAKSAGGGPATAGKKFSQEEILDFYKGVVQQVSELIPQGSVSVEVYADAETKADEFYQWIPNAHIKFPTTAEGLKAAEAAVKEGMRVNMTLCFSQNQAAAVYAATRGATKGQVYVSPFVGRLDDRGENGMDLIANIIKMYDSGDGHVEVLTASVRNTAHVLKTLELESYIMTAPLKVLKEWKAEAQSQAAADLKPIPYEEIDLNKNWQDYDLHHDLTDTGIKRFAEDWNALINK